MPYLTTSGLQLASVMATDPFQPAAGAMALGALETTAIPVDLSSSSYRTLYRIVLGGADPGDVLDIDADARVTNNCGYNIGVAWHLWIYSYTNPLKTNGPWWRISAFSGENVTPDMHHMPLHISTLYRMPADWPPGDRPVIVMRADAHSTAWNSNGGGDTLDVDAGYGQLIVRQWKLPIAA
ncbi:hypothetical protein QA811_01870 [Streptomyces sp. B21-102]|uniref:hypothetical protein n=1 Tax=Streptomyces sp. B21-102 TaxID=3039416 RepID=UPI002FEEC79E